MLYEIFFLLLVALYFTISIKIDYWTTISILGFKSETPMLFLQKPKYYESVRGVLFLSAIGLSFMTNIFPWYANLAFLAFIWLCAGSIGRKQAFSMYRNILKQMLEHAETKEEKDRYLTEIQLTNEDLTNKILEN